MEGWKKKAGDVFRSSAFGVRCTGFGGGVICWRIFYVIETSLLWYVAEMCPDWLCLLRFSCYQQVNMAFSVKCTNCLEHDEDCVHPKSTRQKSCDACAFSKAKCDLQEKLRRSGKKRKRHEGGEESELEDIVSPPPPRK